MDPDDREYLLLNGANHLSDGSEDEAEDEELLVGPGKCFGLVVCPKCFVFLMSTSLVNFLSLGF